METERDRSCKTGFYKISTVDSGGVVFAPTPRDYSMKLNKKKKEQL